MMANKWLSPHIRNYMSGLAGSTSFADVGSLAPWYMLLPFCNGVRNSRMIVPLNPITKMGSAHTVALAPQYVQTPSAVILCGLKKV